MKTILGKKESRAEGEVIMKTKESPYALFDISVNWNEDKGHVICIEKDHRLAELESIVDIANVWPKRILSFLKKKSWLKKHFLRLKVFHALSLS